MVGGGEDIVKILAGIIGGGGMVAGFVAFYKAPAEAGRIAVSAAEGAVIVQSAVIDKLNDQVERAMKEVKSCRGTIDYMVRENARLMSERVDLLKRIDRLEHLVGSLERRRGQDQTDHHRRTDDQVE